MKRHQRTLVVALGLARITFAADFDQYLPVLTKPPDASPFFAISLSGKWGFMTASGTPVIQPRYDNEGYFFNGLARVKVGKLWGFINTAGRVMIRPQFDAAGDFQGALAPVRVGKKWGYIDQKGRMVITPRFEGAAAFQEALARVQTWTKVLCNKIVHSNDTAPAEAFYIQPDFASLQSTCFPVDARIGYIDLMGRFVVPPRFRIGHDFHEGLALVREVDGNYGYLDRNGNIAIGFQFDEGRDFSEGLAAVLVGRRVIKGIREPGSFGYINRSGKFVILDQFSEAGTFSEGLAAVSFWHRRVRGYIDKSGKLVVPTRFVAIDPFSDGLARACYELDVSSWRCIYINREAKIVIKAVQARHPFSSGLALAEDENGAKFYINADGNPVAPVEVGTKLHVAHK